MLRILFSWIVTTVAILIVAEIVPGIRVASIGSAIVAAAVLGLLNVLVKPILVILTLPITIVTLGLFLIVINALLLQLTAWLITGFRVQSFWAALLGAIIISIITYIIHWIF